MRRTAKNSNRYWRSSARKGQEGATRWERFKRWLKEKLEKRKDDDEASALEKWSRQFQTSEGIAQAITYAGYVMVAC